MAAKSSPAINYKVQVAQKFAGALRIVRLNDWFEISR